MREADAITRIREAYRVMGDLLRGIDWELFDLCDCGHRRVEHVPSRLSRHGSEPCCHRECDCRDFAHAHVGNPLRKAA